MEYRPFRRVGEPSSFKGIKGPYLFSALRYTVGMTSSLLIIFILPISKTFQLIIVGAMALLWFRKIKEYKEKSKGGDIHKMNKDRCRKYLNIKS